MDAIRKYLYVCALAVAIVSCKDDKWDEHAKITGKLLGVSLKEAIQGEADCSAFYAALVSTGYDTLLATANSFTVFAPTNSAWQAVSAAGVKAAVANHIAYGKRLSVDPDFLDSALYMLNGKQVRCDGQTKTFNGAAVISGDHVAANGVFHVTDKVIELRDNVWDCVRKLSRASYPQVQFLLSASINRNEMDMVRSVQVGVNATGQPVYDTVMISVNAFLKEVPLGNEKKEWTYIVLQSAGHTALFNTYRPYLKSADARTDSLTGMHICRDFAFEGKIDIRQHDTIVNISGVKVPVMQGASIVDERECSNGRVYIVREGNIPLREKIKPVLIEGESYNPGRAADPSFIFTRYNPARSGGRDMMLAGRATQTDSIHVIGSAGQDSVYTLKKTFITESGDGNKPNVYNSYVEYKASVYAVKYEIHYVAYDDIEGHYSDPLQTLRIEQKLFVSMPGAALQKGPSGIYSSDAIVNNYMTDKERNDITRFDTCFVAIDTAGVLKERKMQKWTISKQKAQAIQAPVKSPQAYIMPVPAAGELTLWLCNTARDKDYAAQLQGFLFLDYIKLVPVFD
jgi:hypothetical protein